MAASILTAAAREHTDEAFANFQRYELFRDDPAHTSWSVVFLFYSALHLVEAYHKSYHPHVRIKDHLDRNKFVNSYLNYIDPNYFLLYKISKRARYDLKHYSKADAQKIHDDHFERIRDHLEGLGIEWSVTKPLTPGGASP